MKPHELLPPSELIATALACAHRDAPHLLAEIDGVKRCLAAFEALQPRVKKLNVELEPFNARVHELSTTAVPDTTRGLLQHLYQAAAIVETTMHYRPRVEHLAGQSARLTEELLGHVLILARSSLADCFRWLAEGMKPYLTPEQLARLNAAFHSGQA